MTHHHHSGGSQGGSSSGASGGSSGGGGSSGSGQSGSSRHHHRGNSAAPAAGDSSGDASGAGSGSDAPSSSGGTGAPPPTAAGADHVTSAVARLSSTQAPGAGTAHDAPAAASDASGAPAPAAASDGSGAPVPAATGDDVMLPGSDVAGHRSSFHLISQISGRDVHSGLNRHWSWTDNGCHPTSVVGSLRWFSEQGRTGSAQALNALVADASRKSQPWEYAKLLFPTVNPDGERSDTPRAQWVANTQGMVPWTLHGSDANCDHGALAPAGRAMTGLSYRNWSDEPERHSNPLGVFRRWLRDAPIIVCLTHPGHFITVHGVVGGKIWVADPGRIIFHSWYLSEPHTAGHRACPACNEHELGAGMPADGHGLNRRDYLAIDGTAAYHVGARTMTFFQNMMGAGQFFVRGGT